MQKTETGPKTLDDFLRYQDEQFVRIAYNYILKREPDESGLGNYLQLLRSGKIGKICLLGSMRFSPEGKQIGVVIKGLEKAYFLSRIFRLPVLGYAFRSLYILLRLPIIFHLNEAPGSIENTMSKQQETISELQRQLSKVIFSKADRSAISDLDDKLQVISSQKPDRNELEVFSALRESCHELQRQMSRLEFAKADKNSLAELDSSVSGRLASKVTLEELKELAFQLETKIGQHRAAVEDLLVPKELVAELQRQLSRLEFSKADRKSVADLSDSVSSGLTAKASLVQLEELSQSVEAKAEKKHLAELASRVESKAEQQHLDELTARMDNKAEKQHLAEMASNLETKASQQHLDELTARMDNKAATQHLAEMASNLETKASQQHLDELTARMDNKAEKQHLAELASRLEAKASKQHLDELTARMDNKAEKQHLAELASRLEMKAGQQLLDELGSRLESKTDYSYSEALAAEIRVTTQLAEQLTNQLETKAGKDELSNVSLRVGACEDARVSPLVVQNIQDTVHGLGRQTEDHKQSLLDQQRRLGIFLEQARKRLPEPFSKEQVQEIASEDDHFLDTLYVAFEDRFRGSREDIKERCKVFLPHVKEALARTANAPVLDIACGRGEWLQLLKESGIEAQGVDFNRLLVEQCGEFGLAVTQADALQYLRKQKNRSFSMVSSFHFIEHIPLRMLIAIMDEMLRVLKPGGLALMETPNARNLLVTAGDFYRDPTHKRPIFPDTLEALAEFRGFSDSTVYCFNEGRTEIRPIREMKFDDLGAYVTISRDAVWMGKKAE